MIKRLLRETVRKTLHTIERPWDASKAYLKRRYDLYGPIEIVPYRGYGTPQQCRILGRVLENKQIAEAKRDSRWWQNARSIIRRFRTDEVPGCRLQGEMDGQRQCDETDSEGYFELNFRFDAPLNDDESWHPVRLKLLDGQTRQSTVQSIGSVLIPPPKAQFGVISDIDDTILKSAASDLFQLVRLTLVNNAHTRVPVTGAAEFYRALERGTTDGHAANPFFYVSSSAWNLYDLFCDFMDIHDFPQGVVLLRDLGIDSMKLIKSGHDQKLEKIREIMRCYPDLKFILVGDSGQRDAWLYRDAAREFPGRILAIYLHDVRRSRRADVTAVAGELNSQGVETLLVQDATAAAQHAAERNWIRSQSLEPVAAST